MFRQSTSRTFDGRINVAFINITSDNILQQRPVPSTRHTVFAFLISALFNFLQLRYQGAGGTVSPFQTHPTAMWVALFSLLLYCVAYELKPSFIQMGRGGMGLFGSILSVSLASVLFHNSVSLALYFLYVLFSNREMLCSGFEVFWNWIHQRMVADRFRVTRSINWRCFYQTGEAFSHCKECGCMLSNHLLLGVEGEELIEPNNNKFSESKEKS